MTATAPRNYGKGRGAAEAEEHRLHDSSKLMAEVLQKLPDGPTPILGTSA
ncbi:MAG: hypothetical protein LUQ59_03285 [Methanothrix sp.]|nr:hypothetical protein [Methanothrix sp.]